MVITVANTVLVEGVESPGIGVEEKSRSLHVLLHVLDRLPNVRVALFYCPENPSK